MLLEEVYKVFAVKLYMAALDKLKLKSSNQRDKQIVVDVRSHASSSIPRQLQPIYGSKVVDQIFHVL
jgi:hypothetical protein